MRVLQRIMVILTCLCLVGQTIRHVDVLWFQPRTSVLDRYDKPLKDEIAAAATLNELVGRYDTIRKDVDRIKAERRASDPKAEFYGQAEEEPFKSEAALREAIGSWEQRAEEILSLRFYWFVGLILALLGSACYMRINRWLGLTLLIAGFAEFIYWTSPTLWGSSTREFDRLLVNKLVLSLLSLALLAVVVRLLGAFREGT